MIDPAALTAELIRCASFIERKLDLLGDHIVIDRYVEDN